MNFLLLLVMLVVLFSISSFILHNPLLIFLGYGVFMLYSSWKMKKLDQHKQQAYEESNHRQYTHQYRPNTNQSIIDVEFSERELRD